MVYEYSCKKLLICGLCIFIVISLCSKCQAAEDGVHQARFFNFFSTGMQQLSTQYCNITCGPNVRFGFSFILQKYCQFKCPNSTLANVSSTTESSNGESSSSSSSSAAPVLKPISTVPGPSSSEASLSSTVSSSPGASSSEAVTPAPISEVPSSSSQSPSTGSNENSASANDQSNGGDSSAASAGGQ